MESIVLPKSSNLLKLPEQLYGTIKRVGILNKEPILYGDVNLLKPNDLYYISGAKLVYRYVKAIIGDNNQMPNELENPSDSLTVKEASGITYLFTTVKPISIESMSDGFSLPEEQLGWVSRAGYLFNQIIYTGDANLVNNGNLYYNDNYPFISIVRFDESDNQIMLYTKYIDDNGDSVTSMVEYKNGEAIPGSCSWEVTIPKDDNVYEGGDIITIPVTVKNTGDLKLSEITVRINFPDGVIETLLVKDLSEDESSTVECTYTVGEEDVERGSSTISVDFYATADIDGPVEEENTASVTYSHNFKDFYLTFEALLSGNFTLKIGSGVTLSHMTSVSYSIDNGNTWVTTTVDNTTQTITTPTINAGDKVLWKGIGKQMASDLYNAYQLSRFSGSNDFEISGNIMSLLYGDDFKDKTSFTEGNYTFVSLFLDASHTINAKNLVLPATTLKLSCYGLMFKNNSNLLTPPELPATTLAASCYDQMFTNCTSLTRAPKLPATTLANSCYSSMFSGCSSLATAPILPATTLTTSCYSNMFVNCSSLTIAPELPATIAMSNCYSYMFSDCTALATAPELPATTLASKCYQGMFQDCTSLTTAPTLPATTLTESCYSGMFSGCSSLTTAPELPATTATSSCYRNMFNKCTGLTVAPELPATVLAQSCYYGMFQYCSALTAAPELPVTTLESTCYLAMFAMCTSLTVAPELPATTLVNQCYMSMFNGCTSLNYIKALFTTTPSNTYTKDWVKNVAATGTFVKNASATWTTTGTNAVPTGWTVQTASS